MAATRVPTRGESVTEATIGKWFKKAGDVVAVDEPVVELETDKVTIEVPSPAAGILTDVAAKDGDTVAVGALLGAIKEGAGAVPAGRPDQKTERAKAVDAGPEQPQLKEDPPPAESRARAALRKTVTAKVAGADTPLAPSVRKLAAETGMDVSTVPGTGKDRRVTKGGMLAAIAGTGKDAGVTKGDVPAALERAAAQPTPVAQPAAAIQARAPSPPDDAAREQRARMAPARE